MRLTKEQVEAFHCPRWEELPALSLYMDQVLIVLEESMQLFIKQKEKGKERVVTPTMINNYVKQKLINPPVKKKYNREHIALLMMIGILKKALSMTEITGIITLMLEESSIQQAYNLFCDKLECALISSFALSKGKQPFWEDADTTTALEAALIALMGKLMVQGRLDMMEEEAPK